MSAEVNPVISVESVETRFGRNVVHQGVTFQVEPGTVTALIGASGTGKSVLLREVIGLLRPSAGRIQLFDCDVWSASQDQLRTVRSRMGVLFQNGGLFSSLSAGENVAVPLKEQSNTPKELIEELVQLRLCLSGLDSGVASKMPSELSGGMVKRVALARALALEPEVLFLDEPTSGLDPINARGFDRLIRTLSDSLGLTVFMVTHDLDTLFGITDRVIVLEAGVVLADGGIEEVVKVKNAWIQEYFSSRVVD